MTLKEFAKLIPEQKHIRIAELCGWTKFLHHRVQLGMAPQGRGNGRNPDVVPDYLNDLNAMHEAEKTLNDEQSDHYINLLTNNLDGDAVYPNRWRLVHATAGRRADAFLLTRG